MLSQRAEIKKKIVLLVPKKLPVKKLCQKFYSALNMIRKENESIVRISIQLNNLGSKNLECTSLVLDKKFDLSVINNSILNAIALWESDKSLISAKFYFEFDRAISEDDRKKINVRLEKITEKNLSFIRSNIKKIDKDELKKILINCIKNPKSSDLILEEILNGLIVDKKEKKIETKMLFDINTVMTHNGYNLCALSILYGNLPSLEKLIERGLKISNTANFETNESISEIIAQQALKNNADFQLIDRFIKLIRKQGIVLSMDESLQKDKKSPLYLACKGGFDDAALFLLKNWANPFLHHTDNTTPLLQAIIGGHKTIVEFILKNFKINPQNIPTYLNAAKKLNQPDDLVNLLTDSILNLDKEVITQFDKYFLSELITNLIIQNQEDKLNILFKKIKSSLKKLNPQDFFMFFSIAAKNKNVNLFGFLLDYFNPYKNKEHFLNLIEIAINNHDTVLFKYLFDTVNNVDLKPFIIENALLLWLLCKCNPEIEFFNVVNKIHFIKNQLSNYKANDFIDSILEMKKEWSKNEIMDFYNFLMNSFKNDNTNYSAIIYAVTIGNISLAKALLQKNYVIDNNILVHILEKEMLDVSFLELIFAITKNKLDWTVARQDGKTIIHLAALLNNYKLMDFISNRLKFDIDKTDKHGRTALWYAVNRSNFPMVEYLCDYFEADPCFAQQQSSSPIEHAYKQKLLSYVDYFLSLFCQDYGLDEEFTLHAALLGNCGKTIINYLTLEKKYDPTKIHPKYGTPLHLAVEMNNADALNALLKCKDPKNPRNNINPDLKNKIGLPPLYYVIKNQKLACLSALIMAGADIDELFDINKIKIAPLDHAVRHGSLKIVQLLIDEDVKMPKGINLLLAPAAKNDVRMLNILFDLPFTVEQLFSAIPVAFHNRSRQALHSLIKQTNFLINDIQDVVKKNIFMKKLEFLMQRYFREISTNGLARRKSTDHTFRLFEKVAENPLDVCMSELKIFAHGIVEFKHLPTSNNPITNMDFRLLFENTSSPMEIRILNLLPILKSNIGLESEIKNILILIHQHLKEEKKSLALTGLLDILEKYLMPKALLSSGDDDLPSTVHIEEISSQSFP